MIKRTKKNMSIIGRIHNWKFEAAERDIATSDISEDDANVVKLLSSMFGNVGWFDSDMGGLVSIVVSTLIKER